MQSYGDFQLIPRKIPDSSPTYMDKRRIVGHIAETGQKVVQKSNFVWFLKEENVEDTFVGFADLCRDSAIQASLIALAAPSVRK